MRKSCSDAIHGELAVGADASRGAGTRAAPYPIDVTNGFDPKMVWFIEKCRELEDEKHDLLRQKLDMEAEVKKRAAEVAKAKKETQDTKQLVREVRPRPRPLRSPSSALCATPGPV